MEVPLSLLESMGSGKVQKPASVPTPCLLPAPSAKQPGKLQCTVTGEQTSVKSWPSGSKNRPWIPIYLHLRSSKCRKEWLLQLKSVSWVSFLWLPVPDFFFYYMIVHVDFTLALQEKESLGSFQVGFIFVRITIGKQKFSGGLWFEPWLILWVAVRSWADCLISALSLFCTMKWWYSEVLEHSNKIIMV